MTPTRGTVSAPSFWSGRTQGVVRDEKVCRWHGRGTAGSDLDVAETPHEQRLVISCSTTVPTCRVQACEEGSEAMHQFQGDGRSFFAPFFVFITAPNRYEPLARYPSLARIQIVFTKALFPCALMVASRAPMCPPGVPAIGAASLERAASSAQRVADACCR